MQQQWIGRSPGVRVMFDVIGDDTGNAAKDSEPVTVFTTRADTLMGVTFLAVAPEHPLAQRYLGATPPVTSSSHGGGDGDGGDDVGDDDAVRIPGQ